MSLEDQNKTLKEANKNLQIGIKAVDNLSQIRQGLIDHKSQLIDGGLKEDSLTIVTINELVKLTDVRK